MPAAVAVPLITAGIGGATSAFGAHEQANASENAAALQAQGIQQALDFTKAQKAKQEAAANPYLSLGGMAVGQLPQIAARAPMGGPPAPYGAPQQPMAMQPSTLGGMAGGMPQPPQGGGMITLRGPDGSTRQFAATDPRAQQAMQMGAVRV